MTMSDEKIRERFTCLKRDSGDCVKDMVGNVACEFCDIYANCGYCGLKGTEFCRTCLINVIKDEEDRE